VRILVLGAGGRVGSALAPRLAEAGHEVAGVERGTDWSPEGHEAAIDFTTPEAVRGNVERCLAAGIPCVVGTTGLGDADLAAFDAVAREHGVACFVAPNFALGAVLMMRFAAEAARHFPRAEIVELHHEAKRDAPSGTALALARAIDPDGGVPIASVRAGGITGEHDIAFTSDVEEITIGHRALSRAAFAAGAVRAAHAIHNAAPGWYGPE
jgi:4-hydroxy-tetrahydrodipicolinate reductase